MHAVPSRSSSTALTAKIALLVRPVHPLKDLVVLVEGMEAHRDDKRLARNGAKGESCLFVQCKRKG